MSNASRSIAWFVFRLGLCTALLHASGCTSAAAGDATPTSKVLSIALTVDDLPRARKFFIEALGFHEEAAPDSLRGTDFEALTGLAGAQAQRLRLTLGGEHIELLHFSQPPGRPAPTDARSDDLWFQHLALVTSDIDAAHTRVVAAGAGAISPSPQTIPASNRAAAGIRAFYFRGPASHPLELIWYPPGKGRARWQSTAAALLGIDHTAIAVSNTERSRKFYADGLGLRVAGHSFNYGHEQAALSAVPGARVRITGLRGADGPGVELLEYEVPKRGRNNPADTRANDLWHSEITVAVTNLDEIVSRLRASGVRFISKGVHSTREFGTSGTRGIDVLDPDGHAIRVVE